MIDTHAHLDFPEFDEDRDVVMARFFEEGGKAIINIGVDLKTSEKSIDLAEARENVYVAVGFHPHDASEKISLPADDDIEKMKKLALHKKVKAIGEIGLDYFYYKESKQIEQQKVFFEKQLKIAKYLNLPVVIHCRDAWEDLYNIISNYPEERFVLHCYSGGEKDTKKFLEMPNVLFSFSGNITYPKPIERANNLAEAVRMIPLDKIMLDSDAPFLAPQEVRGKRNEPSFIRFIAKKIAEIKGISESIIEKETDENAEKFFNL